MTVSGSTFEAIGDRLDGLARIGIDETSYKSGTGSDRGCRDITTPDGLVWAAPGRRPAPQLRALDQIGPSGFGRSPPYRQDDGIG